jgi:hypothetical protein
VARQISRASASQPPQPSATGPGAFGWSCRALLDETAQPGAELVLGIPFHQVLELWAAICLEQARLADDAFTLLATLDL